LGLGVEDRIVRLIPAEGIRKSNVPVETTERRASESKHPEVAKKIEHVALAFSSCHVQGFKVDGTFHHVVSIRGQRGDLSAKCEYLCWFVARDEEDKKWTLLGREDEERIRRDVIWCGKLWKMVTNIGRWTNEWEEMRDRTMEDQPVVSESESESETEQEREFAHCEQQKKAQWEIDGQREEQEAATLFIQIHRRICRKRSTNAELEEPSERRHEKILRGEEEEEKGAINRDYRKQLENDAYLWKPYVAW
jgi:hypothetical protein